MWINVNFTLHYITLNKFCINFPYYTKNLINLLSLCILKKSKNYFIINIINFTLDKPYTDYGNT